MTRSFVYGKSKRDLVINQVPITTKPEVTEVLPKSLLREVTMDFLVRILRVIH